MCEANIRILIADDHYLIRDGIRWRLQDDPSLLCVGEVSDGADLTDAIRLTAPDLLILDLSMPNLLEPATFVRQIKQLHPSLRILVLTGHHEKEYILALVTAGADGYLLKDDLKRNLLDALHQIIRGEGYFSDRVMNILVQQVRQASEPNAGTPVEELTAREVEVLELIAQGLTNLRIASTLSISLSTVSNHINKIYSKLGLRSREEAIRYMYQHTLNKSLTKDG